METPLERTIRLAGLRGVGFPHARGRGSGQDRVRTPEGRKKYGEPIGALIRLNPVTGKPMTAREKGLSGTPGGHTVAGGGQSAKPKAGHKKYGPHNEVPVDLTRTSVTRKSTIPPKVYNRHAQMVDAKLRELEKSHATHNTETISRGIYKPERYQQHQEIIDTLYADARNVPNEGKALFSGGLSGAGKTTVLTQYAGVNLENYLVVNADDIKEIMAQRGMVPEVAGLSPMEASALVHREAVVIAEALVERAIADNKNVLRDVTMAGAGNGAKNARERVMQLKDAGYEVDAIFVDVPVALSIKRMHARHRDGMEDFAKGKGLGGRYISPNIIRENEPPEGSDHNSSNSIVLDELKPLFVSWRFYDNSVDREAPTLKREHGGFGERMAGQTIPFRDRLSAGVTGDAREQVAAEDAEDLGTTLSRHIDNEAIRLTVLRRLGVL